MHKPGAIATVLFAYLRSDVDQKFGNFSTVRPPIMNRLSPDAVRSAILYSPVGAFGATDTPIATVRM
jgi:hypothetical protein